MAVLVAAMMIMATMVPAWAAEPGPASETINISLETRSQVDSVATTNEEYVAFRIFTATKTADTVGDTTSTPASTQTPEEGISYFLAANSAWAKALVPSGTVLTSVVPYLTFTPAADNSGWTVSWNTYNASTNTSGKEYNEANAIALADILKGLITEGLDTTVTPNKKTYTVGGEKLTGNGDPVNASDDYFVLTPGSNATVKTGYYLITSSLGSNLILATTDVTIKEKNTYPLVDKNIIAATLDSSITTAGVKKTDAQIGDTIKFELKATIPDEASHGFALHDKMDLGLSLKLSGEKVFRVYKTIDGTKQEVESNSKANWFVEYSSDTAKLSAYTPETPSTNGVSASTAATTGTSLATDDSFVVVFTDAYIDSLNLDEAGKDAVFTVEYEAVLNDAALLTTGNSKNQNDNNVYLKYSNYVTTDVTTQVYTHEIDIVKYYEDNSTNKVLNGAKFKLYRSDQLDSTTGLLKASPSAVGFVKSSNSNTYTVVDGLDSGDTVVYELTSTDGKFDIKGLDAGTYYLEETQAPSGYNKLQYLIKIVVDEKMGTGALSSTVIGTKVTHSTTATVANGKTTYPDAVTNADGKATFDESNTTIYTSGGVGVKNEAGFTLPSTGGMGTTVLYIVGGMLVILAGAYLFFSRKRTA